MGRGGGGGGQSKTCKIFSNSVWSIIGGQQDSHITDHNKQLLKENNKISSRHV